MQTENFLAQPKWLELWKKILNVDEEGFDFTPEA